MEDTQVIDYIKQAFELKESKNYKPAIEMLYKALEIENDNVEILFQIGELVNHLSIDIRNKFQKSHGII